jgi:hypothetical protein
MTFMVRSETRKRVEVYRQVRDLPRTERRSRERNSPLIPTDSARLKAKKPTRYREVVLTS